MSQRRPFTSKTADELVRKLPGWKPQPAAAAADGEEAGELHTEPEREPVLPDFAMSKTFNFVSKNATDSVRQQ